MLKIDMIQGLIFGLKEQIHRLDQKETTQKEYSFVINEYLKAIKDIVNEEDNAKSKMELIKEEKNGD